MACLGLLALLLVGTGCKHSPYRPTGAAPSGGGGLGDHTGPSATPASDRDRKPVGGLLAGQVVDTFSRRYGSTKITVVESREDGGQAPAPLEVAADTQGYFTIPGLQPGKHYQLVAEVRDGGRVLAGSTWATPPDPRILIRVSEDLAGPGAAGPHPGWPGSVVNPPGGKKSPNDPKKPAATLDKPVPKHRPAEEPADPPATENAPPHSLRPAVELGPPRAGHGEHSAPAPFRPSRPENVVIDPQPDRPNGPKPAVVPGPALSVPGPPDPGMSRNSAPSAVAVPSCLVSNQKLDNFALYDLDGNVWEFKKSPHGRLVLLDFWGTWCPPCLAAVKHLIQLQNQYNRYGLDVVGIEYEDAPLSEQVAKVKSVRDRMGINYRLLLGSDKSTCPVKTQFGVTGFPTVILLDENGHILWRSVGFEKSQAQQLEGVIRQHLGMR